MDHQHASSNAASAEPPVEVPVSGESSQGTPSVGPRRQPKARPEPLAFPDDTCGLAATATADRKPRQYGTFAPASANGSADRVSTPADKATTAYQRLMAQGGDDGNADQSLWGYLTSPQSPLIQIRDHCHHQWVAVVLTIVLLGIIAFMLFGSGAPDPARSCNTGFGVYLGENNEVGAYSNCRYAYSGDGLDHFVTVGLQRVYSGSKWHALEYARRYWLLTRFLTFPSLETPAMLFNVSHAIVVSTRNVGRLRRALSEGNHATMTTTARTTFYGSTVRKGQQLPLRHYVNLPLPLLRGDDSGEINGGGEGVKKDAGRSEKILIMPTETYYGPGHTPSLPTRELRPRTAAALAVDENTRTEEQKKKKGEEKEAPHGKGHAREGDHDSMVNGSDTHDLERPIALTSTTAAASQGSPSSPSSFASQQQQQGVNGNGVPLREFALDRTAALPQEGDLVVYKAHRTTLRTGHVAVVVGVQGPFRTLADVGHRILDSPRSGEEHQRLGGNATSSTAASSGNSGGGRGGADPMSPDYYEMSREGQWHYTAKDIANEKGGGTRIAATVVRTGGTEKRAKEEGKKSVGSAINPFAYRVDEDEEDCVLYRVYLAEQNWNNRPWVDLIREGKVEKEVRRSFSRVVLLKEYYPSRTYRMEDNSGQHILGWVRPPV